MEEVDLSNVKRINGQSEMIIKGSCYLVQDFLYFVSTTQMHANFASKHLKKKSLHLCNFTHNSIYFYKKKKSLSIWRDVFHLSVYFHILGKSLFFKAIFLKSEKTIYTGKKHFTCSSGSLTLPCIKIT